MKGLVMCSFARNRFPIEICDLFLIYFTYGVKLLRYR